MAKKHRDKKGVDELINALILEGLPNLEVLARVRAKFPGRRTRPEQVRVKRGQMRTRHKDKHIPTSVEARRLLKAKRGEGGSRR